jgi:hypothetical protein
LLPMPEIKPASKGTTPSMALFADDAVSLANRLGIDTFGVLATPSAAGSPRSSPCATPNRVSALILAATTPGQLGLTESPDDDQGPPPPPK